MPVYYIDSCYSRFGHKVFPLSSDHSILNAFKNSTNLYMLFLSALGNRTLATEMGRLLRFINPVDCVKDTSQSSTFCWRLMSLWASILLRCLLLIGAFSSSMKHIAWRIISLWLVLNLALDFTFAVCNSRNWHCRNNWDAAKFIYLFCLFFCGVIFEG